MARYRSYPVTVDARELTEAAQIGSASGEPGDYLVTFPDGGVTIVAKGVFESQYRSIKTAGRKKKSAKAEA